VKCNVENLAFVEEIALPPKDQIQWGLMVDTVGVVKVEGVATKCMNIDLWAGLDFDVVDPDEVSSWEFVVSAEFTVGPFTKKFNHVFKPGEGVFGFANFATWKSIEDLNLIKDGQLELKVVIRSLPPTIRYKEGSRSGSSDDQDYQDLLYAGEEQHCLVRFTRLWETKKNELHTVYNPASPGNQGKKLWTQWNMAIRTLEGGKKELDQTLLDLKKKNLPIKKEEVPPKKTTNQLLFLRTVVDAYYELDLAGPGRGWPFMGVFDPSMYALTDYQQVVKRHMDFSIIKTNLMNNIYSNAKECIDDFRLVFNNASLYNNRASGAAIFQLTQRLEQFLEKMLEKMPETEEEMVDPEHQDRFTAEEIFEKKFQKSASDTQDGGRARISGEKLQLKLSVLQRDIEILLMKYNTLMKDHIPIAQHPLWVSLTHYHKDIVLKTLISLDKVILEPLREVCWDKETCKVCTAPRKMPCFLTKFFECGDGNMSVVGHYVKYSFIQLLKQSDQRLRTHSIDVFNSAFYREGPCSNLSDVQALKKMSPSDYRKLVPQDTVPVLGILMDTVFKEYLEWILRLKNDDLILVTAHFINICPEGDSDGTYMNQTFMGEYGLCGVLVQMLHLFLSCLDPKPAFFNLELWKFNQDIIDPFLALIRTPYRGDLPSSFMKSFEKINYEIWNRKPDDYTRSNFRKKGKMLKANKSKCMCRKETTEYSYGFGTLDDRDPSKPLTIEQVDRMEMTIYSCCSFCECRLRTVAHLIPQVHRLLVILKGGKISHDNDLSRDMLSELYKLWSEIRYNTVRNHVSSCFHKRNLIVEGRKVVRLTESNNELMKEKYQTILTSEKNLAYVNNLPVLDYDEDDVGFPCSTVTVLWKGTIGFGLPLTNTNETLDSIEMSASLLRLPSLDELSPSPEKGDPDPHQELVKLWTELAESGDPDSINKAHAVPIKLGRLRSDHLRSCYKVIFKCDMTHLETNMVPVDLNCVALIFKSKMGYAGLYAVRNEANQWIGLLSSRGIYEFPTFKGTLQDEDEGGMEQMKNHEFKRDFTLPVTPVELYKCTYVEQCYELSQYILQNRSKQSLLQLTQPAIPVYIQYAQGGEKEWNCYGVYPTKHLTACEHNLSWRGTITLLGLTKDSFIRKANLSAWAYICKDALQNRYEPDSSFWSRMPEDLVMVECNNPTIKKCLSDLREKMPIFQLGIGSLRTDLIREKIFVGFLIQDEKIATDVVVMAESPHCVPSLNVYTMSRGFFKLSLARGMAKEEEVTTDDDAMRSIWWSSSQEFRDLGLPGAEGLFASKPSSGLNRGVPQPVEVKVPSVQYFPPLYALNQRRGVTDTSLGKMLWTGDIAFLFLFKNQADELQGLDVTPTDMDVHSEIRELHFPGMVGAYVNQGVRLPSDHQAYTLKGCITGPKPPPDLKLFSATSGSNHTLVALRVNKKQVDTHINRFKKCYYYSVHLHDHFYVYADLKRHSSYMFAFFVPEGQQIQDIAKTKEQLVNKFLILKYDERVNNIVAYYPRDQNKRAQLLEALFAKDFLSIPSHVKHLIKKPKKVKDEAAMVARMEDNYPSIRKFIEEKKADGTFSDVKVQKVVKGNEVSLKYIFERASDKQEQEQKDQNTRERYLAEMKEAYLKQKEIKKAEREAIAAGQLASIPTEVVKLPDRPPQEVMDAVDKKLDGIRTSTMEASSKEAEPIGGKKNVDEQRKDPEDGVEWVEYVPPHVTRNDKSWPPTLDELLKGKPRPEHINKKEEKSTLRESSVIIEEAETVEGEKNVYKKNLDKKKVDKKKDEKKKVEEKRRGRVCWLCRTEQKDGIKTALCAGCRVARYCNRVCQENHWLLHAEWCLEKKQEREERERKRSIELD